MSSEGAQLLIDSSVKLTISKKEPKHEKPHPKQYSTPINSTPRTKNVFKPVPTALTKSYDPNLVEVQMPTILSSRYATEFFKAKDRIRSDTPDTLMTEFSNKPDITVKCEKCGVFIGIRMLQDHRSFHNALTLMKYKNTTLPNNAEALLKRRNALLRRLKKESTGSKVIDPKTIQLIDAAYERLKSEIEDTFDVCRQIKYEVNTNVNGVALNCSPSCALAVGICSSQNERWKNVMEDTRVYQDYFGDDQDKCFLALYDGHHGRFAAEIAAAELHRLLLNEMTKFDPKTKNTAAVNLVEEHIMSSYNFERPGTKESERVLIHQESVDIVQQIIKLCEEKYQELVHEKHKKLNPEDKRKERNSSKHKHPLAPSISAAMKKVYNLIDILLSYGKDECSKVRWSGCSALTAIIQATDSKDKENSEVSGEPDDSGEEDIDEMEPVQLGLIHLANAGNVHALLVRGNKPHRLSKDHTPNNPKEKKRVLKNGGKVSETSRECLVNGVIATTRGLGNHGDPGLKKCVMVEPSTVCVPIDQFAQFLVLATNGVWEIFSDQEVTSLLVKMLPQNHIPPPSSMSSSLAPLLDEFHSAAVKAGHAGKNRTVSFSNDTELESSVSLVKEARSSDAVGSEEKVQTTSTPVEAEKAQIHLTVEADLKTEMGSHLEDADDQGDDDDLDQDLISLPIHVDIPDFVPETVADNQRELAKGMAEYLVQAALLAGAKDNVSAMVVLLPGSGV